MVHNTENGASLQKLPDKSQMSEKDHGYYSWILRKRKVKHQQIFRNYWSRLARALSTIRAGRDRAVEEMLMRKLTKN